MGEKVHYESKLLILPKIWECRKASFAFNASKLFNELPRNLRDLTQCSIKSFKNKLDAFLNMVPDEPQIVGLTQLRRAASNSITEMVQWIVAGGSHTFRVN